MEIQWVEEESGSVLIHCMVDQIYKRAHGNLIRKLRMPKTPSSQIHPSPFKQIQKRLWFEFIISIPPLLQSIKIFVNEFNEPFMRPFVEIDIIFGFDKNIIVFVLDFTDQSHL